MASSHSIARLGRYGHPSYKESGVRIVEPGLNINTNMRYQEILERDESKIISSLKAVIDHPTTIPSERAAAQARLDHLLAKAEKAKEQEAGIKAFTPKKFEPGMVYGKNGQMQTPGGKPAKFVPTKF